VPLPVINAEVYVSAPPALSDPRWHVLGAGAIGCLFGAALARKGYDTTLILRSAARGNSTPVIVQSGGRREALSLPVFSAGDGKPVTHLLITTKAYDARSALAGISQHLANDCQILLLVNGMGLAEQLQQDLPHLDIYCGTTTEGAYRLAAQHIQHAGRGETRIGRKGQQEPAPWFQHWAATIDTCIWDGNIEAALWSKLSINCIINPLTAVHGCPNGDLARLPKLAAQVTRLCDEVALISRAAGFADIATTLPQTVARVIAGTADNRSSMLQDVEHGRPTEIDFITGYLLTVATQHGIEAPHNSALLERIKNSAH
jgi:2-dehydropantoate 2-reductase